MSSVLIAALDAHGQLRFVGEVEKGAACGCFCPSCKSPLLARKGEEREWHFAHEAGQERPECEAGAHNLARALGIEHLREQEAQGRLQLPHYQDAAAVSSNWLHRSEPVSWPAAIAGALQWRANPPKAHPVATGTLQSGVPIALFVQVGDAGPPQLQDLPAECAYISLVVAPAWPLGTRSRAQAMAAIAQTASWRWGYHPDVHGHLAAAQQRLATLEQDVRARREAELRHVREAAGRRWAQIGRQMAQHPLPFHPSTTPPPLQQWSSLHDETPSQEQPPLVPPSPGARDGNARAAPRYDVAPGHAPDCSFQFFRLGPDEAWLFYPLEPAFVEKHLWAESAMATPSTPQKRWAIAPAHGRFDGWDEMLPPTVGRADLNQGIYWVADAITAVTFLSPRAKASGSAHDPAEFDQR